MRESRESEDQSEDLLQKRDASDDVFAIASEEKLSFFRISKRQFYVDDRPGLAPTQWINGLV